MPTPATRPALRTLAARGTWILVARLVTACGPDHASTDANGAPDVPAMSGDASIDTAPATDANPASDDVVAIDSTDSTDTACGGSVHFPAGNLVANASFETDTTGWNGYQSTLASIADCAAPDGTHVARVTRTSGTAYSIDDEPSTVPHATVGTRYHATAFVRAAGAGSVGRPVQIVVRERLPDGATVVSEATGDGTLSTTFAPLAADYTVHATGNIVDVYVIQSSAVAGDAFDVDAITLTPSPTTVDGGVPDAGNASDSGTADSGVSPSGVPMPVGDITGWHQIFADDFTTDVPLGSFPNAVSTRWGAYPDGWHDTSGNGTYYPSRVIRIAGGVLEMNLHTEGGVHMVSAPYPILPGATASNGLSAGRYVARFRADAVPGYKTAWLLWPDSGMWPRDGEIDFPEGDLDSTISAFMHRQNGANGGDQDAYSSMARYPTWHTMVLEWTPTACRFVLDGTTLGTSTSRIPNTPMHWVLQTETALTSTPPSSTAQGNVTLDWVTVYVPH